MTKLKAFANEKINVAQMMFCVYDRIEDIVGKGENAGKHFLLFLQCFQKASFFRVQRIQSSAPPCLEKLDQGKWIIHLYLTVGRVQNGRRKSKNSEIFWGR